MTINTKHAIGRRELHFTSLDEVLADAEKLAAGEVELKGNWTLGQILDHLAISMNKSIDGATFRPPWFVRLVAPLMKRRFLTKPMASGFQMPAAMVKDFMPSDSVSKEDALAALRAAVERQKTESKRAPNVAFGVMTNEEWEQLHLRHSEMHLSFAVPK